MKRMKWSMLIVLWSKKSSPYLLIMERKSNALPIISSLLQKVIGEDTNIESSMNKD